MFLPGKMGMDIINNFVIFAICRARYHLNPSEVPDTSQTPEPCFPVNKTYSYERSSRYFAKDMYISKKFRHNYALSFIVINCHRKLF